MISGRFRAILKTVVNEVSGNYLTNVSSLSHEVNVVRQLLSDSERLIYLEALLCAYVTNGVAENEHYQQLRQYFTSKFDTRGLLPRWLKTFKSLAAVWEYLRFQASTAEGRKDYIHSSLSPLKDYLRASQDLRKASLPLETLDVATAEAQPSLWSKAKEECWDKPDAATTLAIMAFENSLDSLLGDLELEQATPSVHKLGLYARYQELIKKLELYPSLQSSVGFGSVLDGLAEIVSGLDLLSSELGELSDNRLLPGQAELTVSLASAISDFLTETTLSLKELD